MLLAILFAGFISFVHPFLAASKPVDADVMVVEGWVPDYVLKEAAFEFKVGSYSHLFVSGLKDASGDVNNGNRLDAARCARRLSLLGVEPSLIEACPISPVLFNRTSHMAKAVAARMREQHFKPRGVNVITLGPHGRQSLLAYRRLIDPSIPVGVITIPKDDYDPALWWISSAGIKKTTKDFAGWLKEVLFGLRS
jgi:hypothetical protein